MFPLSRGSKWRSLNWLHNVRDTSQNRNAGTLLKKQLRPSQQREQILDHMGSPLRTGSGWFRHHKLMKPALVVPVRNSKFFLTIKLVVMPESWGLQFSHQLNTLDWTDDSYISCASRAKLSLCKRRLQPWISWNLKDDSNYFVITFLGDPWGSLLEKFFHCISFRFHLRSYIYIHVIGYLGNNPSIATFQGSICVRVYESVNIKQSPLLTVFNF